MIRKKNQETDCLFHFGDTISCGMPENQTEAVSTLRVQLLTGNKRNK